MIGICLLLITLFAYTYLQIPKTAFIDNEELFAQFKGKQELESRLKNKELTDKVILDSITLHIQHLQGLKQAIFVDSLLRQQQVFLRLQEQFLEEEQTLAQEYTNKAWLQLQQYVVDYGKTNGYDYIFTKGYQQGVIYGKEEKDITKEVIIYANQRYFGH